MSNKKICRVCQTTSKIKDYTKIYGDDIKIAKDIYEISAVQVIELSSTDPAMICSDCLLNLKISINFKKSCKQSDDQFRKCFKDEELKRWGKNYETLKKRGQNQVAQVVIKQEVRQEMTIKCEPLVCSDDDDNGAFDNNWCNDDNHEDLDKDLNQKENLTPPVTAQKVEPPEVKKKMIKQGLFKCENCPKFLSSKKGLYTHRRKMHNSKSKFSCFKCDARFDTLRKYDNHVSIAHGEGTFYCDLCGQVFRSFSKLRRHIKSKQTFQLNKFKQKPSMVNIQCAKCDRLYQYLSNYDRHMNMYHGEGTFYCDCCGKMFDRLSKLRRHLDHKIYYAKEDVRERSRASKRNARLNAKLNPTSAKICITCGRFFPTLTDLQRHELSHLDEALIPYHNCTLCNFKSKRKASVALHMRAIHMKLRYSCPYEGCSNDYARKPSLNDHIKTVHEKIFDFNCEFCGKAFAAKWKLDKHTRVHTGDARYECKFCGQKFIQNTDCRRHEWKHTAFKGNVECPNCKERFIKHSDLQSHLPRCQRY